MSGWFGSKMVYEQGMRVKGISPVEDKPDLKTLPADRHLEQAFQKVEQYAPSVGPAIH